MSTPAPSCPEFYAALARLEREPTAPADRADDAVGQLQQYLQLIMRHGAGVAGAVWQQVSPWQLCCRYTSGVKLPGWSGASAYHQDVLLNIEAAVRGGQVEHYSSGRVDGAFDGGEVRGERLPTSLDDSLNPDSMQRLVLDHRQLLVPIRIADSAAHDCDYVLHVFASDQHRNSRLGLRELAAVQSSLQQRYSGARPAPATVLPPLDAVRIRESLPDGERAQSALDELRRCLAGSEVAIFDHRRAKWAQRAGRAADAFDSLDVCRQLLPLVDHVIRWGRAVWHPEDDVTLPAPLRRSLDGFYRGARARSLAIVPLHDEATLAPRKAAAPGGAVVIVGCHEPLGRDEILEPLETWSGELRLLVGRHRGLAGQRCQSRAG
ncbi:MAG: hypothetical protein KDB14_07085 [Planctomycetales bacterium]|nr:hypothetical protein [Planctomycetales bacterium]